MSLFGSSTQNTTNSNPFGTKATSIFGQSNQQNPSTSNPFLNVDNKTNTSQPQQQTSIFGSLGQPAQQNTSQTGGLFGASQPQQSTGLFGASQPQQTGGIFGQSQSQPQQTSSLFGNTQNTSNALQVSSLFEKPQGQGQSSLFGQPQQQQQQQQQPQPSIFKANATPQQFQQGSVFGGQHPTVFRQTEVLSRKLYYREDLIYPLITFHT